jgi:hypothetical protein
LQEGGKILWDYEIWSVPVYNSADNGQVFLEYICLIFLGLNILSEFRGKILLSSLILPIFFLILFIHGSADIFKALKRFDIVNYLVSPANWLDWSHFVIMSIAWWFWYQQVRMTSQFKIDSSYDILASPADETQARFFMTNSKEEAKFLAFTNSLQDLGQNLKTYTKMTSICGN